MKKLNLHTLKYKLPLISSIQCDYFVEGCIVALEKQQHQPGIILKTEGEYNEEFELIWRTKPNDRGWKEQRIIAEKGAIALSFFLILELTPYQVIQQAIIGTGFDYWLGYKEGDDKYDEDNFLNARLEVSGMNKGTAAERNYRLLQKIKQIQKSDYLGIPAFIIVSEFGTPISTIINKIMK